MGKQLSDGNAHGWWNRWISAGMHDPSCWCLLAACSLQIPVKSDAAFCIGKSDNAFARRKPAVDDNMHC